MALLPPVIEMERLCRHCGYSLKGHTGEPVRCPECGGLNWTENRFQILKRALKSRPHYVIRDRQEKPLYNIQPLPGLRVGHHLNMVHVDGTESLVLKQRAFSLTPLWEIHRPDRPMAVTRRRMWNWWNYQWQIHISGPDNMDVAGNFGNHEYQFRRQNESIATVSRRWFSWQNTFGVEIQGGEDVLLILAATVVLDMIDHSGHM